jgi:hypothetical protein
MTAAPSVRCPHCHAAPGDRCLTNSKRRVSPDGGVHDARVTAAAAELTTTGA